VTYPNPAEGGEVTATMLLNSPIESAHLEIYTLAFRKVKDVSLGNLPAGPWSYTFKLKNIWGNELSNGLYYLVLDNTQVRNISKMLILR